MNFQSNNKIKLLISCRDPGAAGHIIQIAKKAFDSFHFDVYLHASSPAFEMFQKANLPVNYFKSFTTPVQEGNSAEELLKEAAILLERIKPDAILVGLSSPDAGIDEALLVKRKSLPAFAFQDFWGYVNTVFNNKADIYFVLDEEAARLSQALHKVNTRIVGSPKHGCYKELGIQSLRNKYREKLELKQDKLLIGFCGQPLEKNQGYLNTIREFARSVGRVYPYSFLIYRPHPKESEQSVTDTMKIFKKYGNQCKLVCDESFETSMSACDVLCSAFSNCGYDYVFLDKYLEKPLGVTIYLMFDPTLRETYLDYNKIDYLPIVKQEMALVVEDINKLDETLLNASNSEVRELCSKKVKDLLPDPYHSTNKVLDTICNYIQCRDSEQNKE